MRKVGGQIEQPVEGRSGMAPAVPAKGELVEVAPQVLFAHAVQRAAEPALQVGERPVDPRQQDVRRHVADHLADVRAMFSQLPIAREAITYNGGADRHVALDESSDARAGAVLQRLQPHPAGVPFIVEFDGADDLEDADIGDAVVRDGIMLRSERHLGFVDFNNPLQEGTVGIDHRPPQLVQQQPGGLVGPNAELRLCLLGRDAVGVAGHQVDGLEPGAQRQFAPVHDRSGRHRGLAVATGAFPSERLGLKFPALAGAAGWTGKTVRPPELREVARTRALVRKPAIEVCS